MKHLATALVLTLLSTLTQAQMQPGRWEMSSQMNMQGMQMPGHKSTQCLTAQDIAAGKQHQMDDGQSKCQVSDMKTSGASYSYNFDCASAEGKMSGQAKGNSAATTFTTEIKLRMTPDQGVGEITQIMNGRRTGDCK